MKILGSRSIETKVAGRFYKVLGCGRACGSGSSEERSQMLRQLLVEHGPVVRRDRSELSRRAAPRRVSAVSGAAFRHPAPKLCS